MNRTSNKEQKQKDGKNSIKNRYLQTKYCLHRYEQCWNIKCFKEYLWENGIKRKMSTPWKHT